MMHSGQMGALAARWSSEVGFGSEYLCLVYAFGSASYRNFSKNVRRW